MSFLQKMREHEIHEIRIKEIFDGNVFYQDGKELFDHPLVLLLFANRSGSNLLAERLVASKRFSGLQEMLNFDTVGEVSARHDIKSFPDYFRAMAAHNIGDTFFGTKCSVGQLLMLMRWNILSMFQGAKIINIERNDVVDQAVSMSIAAQTKSWSSEQATVTEPVYDYSDIEKYLAHFVDDSIRRRALIQMIDFDSITIEYDDIVSNPRYVVSECCKLFGVTAPAEIPEQTRLKKQGGELNREFAARFRREAQERLLTVG